MAQTVVITDGKVKIGKSAAPKLSAHELAKRRPTTRLKKKGMCVRDRARMVACQCACMSAVQSAFGACVPVCLCVCVPVCLCICVPVCLCACVCI